ncbi:MULTISPECIES: hypothetical protein [Hyphobacterium]|uniref:Uncharacterized protein n=1 Tax=Hyphobacterium vulgare TaxID=1736751 RepID=A0ABV6ZXQ6_9PROT
MTDMKQTHSPPMTAHEPMHPTRKFPVPREDRSRTQRWIHRAALTAFVAIAVAVVANQAVSYLA